MSLSSQPKRILLRASQLLYTTGFQFNNPYDEDYNNLEKVKILLGWIGEDFDFEDVEFISAFIKINESLIKLLDKKEISLDEAANQVQIPEQKKFKVYYEIWGPATLTEKYSSGWDSYFKEWVNDSFQHHYHEGSFSYWEGDYQEYETDNFEPDNFAITDVYELNEQKKPSLSKLVLENTSEILDNLDRETLIELRNIINQKLSS